MVKCSFNSFEIRYCNELARYRNISRTGPGVYIVTTGEVYYDDSRLRFKEISRGQGCEDDYRRFLLSLKYGQIIDEIGLKALLRACN